MNKEFLEALTKISEGESISLAEFYPVNNGDKIGIEFDFNFDFDKVFLDYMSNMSVKALWLLSMFREEIISDIKKDCIKPLYSVFLTPYKDKYTVVILSEYISNHITEIRDNEFRKTIDSIVEEFDKLTKELTSEINSIIDKYTEGYDLGSIKEYTLLYTNGTDRLHRTDFVREGDRSPNEQKAEVQMLIENDLDKEIYKRVISLNPELEGNHFAVRVQVFNGKDVEIIKYAKI